MSLKGDGLVLAAMAGKVGGGCQAAVAGRLCFLLKFEGMLKMNRFAGCLARTLLCLTALIGWARGSTADTVEVGSQVKVDGKIIRQADEGQAANVIVQLDPEISVAFPMSRVRRTTSSGDEELAWYQQELAKVGDDAELHYQLARACKGKGLNAQGDYHYRRAVAIDPRHSKARAALRFARDGLGLNAYEEQQRNRGLINAGGGWHVPDAWAAEQASEQATVESNRWIKELTKLKTLFYRKGRNSEDALAQIKAIDDPLATAAFVRAYKDSSQERAEPAAMRQLYLQKLADFRTPLAIKTLVEAGVYERDANLRDFALEALQKDGRASAVATYLPIIRSEKKKPSEVQAALRALRYFPDPELWREYVDALVTTHTEVRAPGPGFQVGKDASGAAGLGMGGNKPKVFKQQRQNSDALILLQEIAPDANFGYNKAQWRQYFVQRLNGSPSQLRRD